MAAPISRSMDEASDGVDQAPSHICGHRPFDGPATGIRPVLVFASAHSCRARDTRKERFATRPNEGERSAFLRAGPPVWQASFPRRWNPTGGPVTSGGDGNARIASCSTSDASTNADVSWRPGSCSVRRRTPHAGRGSRQRRRCVPRPAPRIRQAFRDHAKS